jgi:N-methylhydantoinase A
MRFVGQAFELSVPVAERPQSMAEVDAAFLDAYRKRYSYAVPSPAEIVTFRLTAYGRVAKPELPKARSGGTLQDARTGERPVAFEGRFAPTPIYDRAALPIGAAIDGPAIVEEPGSSTIVPPGFHASVDGFGNLVLVRR